LTTDTDTATPETPEAPEAPEAPGAPGPPAEDTPPAETLLEALAEHIRAVAASARKDIHEVVAFLATHGL
jgi:hypothetical protein